MIPPVYLKKDDFLGYSWWGNGGEDRSWWWGNIWKILSKFLKLLVMDVSIFLEYIGKDYYVFKIGIF